MIIWKDPSRPMDDEPEGEGLEQKAVLLGDSAPRRLTSVGFG